MAIKIKSLEDASKTFVDQKYVYKDLFLDFEFSRQITPGYTQSTLGSDIKADFDLGAIKNSLTNLFNTLPGQRFLFPEYGLDLYQFLFSPVTVENGDLIGNVIYNGIKTYEPRVIPKQVRVAADPDNNQYFVSIIIEVPVFNIITDTNFLFDIKKQSFVFIETSRNN
jgi:phage baseplate assembly protein W